MRAVVGLALLASVLGGCVGLWGPDVPRPVIYVAPEPVYVAPVIVVPVYRRPYYRSWYWRR